MYSPIRRQGLRLLPPCRIIFYNIWIWICRCYVFIPQRSPELETIMLNTTMPALNAHMAHRLICKIRYEQSSISHTQAWICNSYRLECETRIVSSTPQRLPVNKIAFLMASWNHSTWRGPFFQTKIPQLEEGLRVSKCIARLASSSFGPWPCCAKHT